MANVEQLLNRKVREEVAFNYGQPDASNDPSRLVIQALRGRARLVRSSIHFRFEEENIIESHTIP